MKKIGKAAKWAGILVLCLGVLAFLIGDSSPDTEETPPQAESVSAETGAASAESGGSEDRPKETDAEKNKGKKEGGNTGYSKEGLAAWLAEKLSQEKPAITEDEVKLWGQASEKEFRPAWQKAVLDRIKGWEEAEDYQRTADVIKNACVIYTKVGGSGKAVKNIRQNADMVSSILHENNVLEGLWGIDMRSGAGQCSFETVYIAKKLEMSYSDNLAGKLQKEAESYMEEDYSDWLAYDVEYIMDKPCRGDTCRMIVRTDKDDPFAGEGAYSLALLDEDETITLVDNLGFEQEVPVCTKVGESDAVSGDIARYQSNIEVCITLCQQMEQEIRTGRVQDGQPGAADIDSGDSGNADAGEEDGGNKDFIFADSSERYLDDWELELCSADELTLARNEIYARHGRRFNDQTLQEYFDSMPWYEGTVEPEDFDDGVFNEFEKANLEKIAVHE